MHAIDRLARWLHRHLVVVLSLTYVAAGAFPLFGQRLRWCHLGTLRLGQVALPVPLPTVLLGLLLCSASMGIDARQIRGMRRHPALLFAGLAVNVALPMLFLAGCAGALGGWPDAAELKSLLLGLAILGAMPIAGSSTAWAQQAHGNLALSLSLVLCSTMCSPLVTPLCFATMARLTAHRYDPELLQLAGLQTRAFLMVAVLFPCVSGLVLHGLLGKRRVAYLSPVLRLCSMLSLILLNYANAAVALPHLVGATDWRFAVLAGLLAASLCGLRYGGGWVLGRSMGAPAADTTSVIYGLGMNNNGSGLVLASQHMPNDANLMVLMVLYTLMQQVGAGLAQQMLRRARKRRLASAPTAVL